MRLDTYFDIADALGISRSFHHQGGQLRGFLIKPPGTSQVARRRLAGLLAQGSNENPHEYLCIRVRDAIAGICYEYALEQSYQKVLSGRLSTLDEDLCQGIDYVVETSTGTRMIDFTTDYRQYERKKREKKGGRTLVLIGAEVARSIPDELEKHSGFTNMDTMRRIIHQILGEIPTSMQGSLFRSSYTLSPLR